MTIITKWKNEGKGANQTASFSFHLLAELEISTNVEN